MPSFLLLPRAKRREPRLASPRPSPCPDLATLLAISVSARHPTALYSLLSLSCLLPRRNGANIFFPLTFRARAPGLIK